ncbi:MAG: hypothetical protein AAB656_01430 [Patescibacteria group bacterium]
MKIFIVVLLLFLFSASEALAVYDPSLLPNNKYGIHITNEADLESAGVLVNSNGGNWGYVTLVIQKGERDPKRWKSFFKNLRRLHLIPIVRIATSPAGEYWEAPSVDEIDGWVTFLDELSWPIKNRYVVIGNEPNHAKEWGMRISPEEYANYLKIFSKKLKEKSDKFYVLLAALDASAPNSRNFSGIRDTMDEVTFLKRMIAADPQVFEFVDGWNSHSYPNPGFSGSALASGRGTVKTYLWELSTLKTLGINKEFPVFITETGWVHPRGVEGNIKDRFKYAYENVWNDDQVIAVTPFILNYEEKPFTDFSWKRKDGSFFDFYYTVMALAKISGDPILEPERILDILPIVIPEETQSPASTPGSEIIIQKTFFEELIEVLPKINKA